MQEISAILSALAFAAAAGASLVVAPLPVALFLWGTFTTCAVLLLAARDRRIRVDAEEAALRDITGDRA